ncbi:MAG: radical SAM protein [Aminipila sp.]
MKKLIMDRVSCHVTAKCNLRCKKCAVYIPKLYEIGDVPEYDIDDIKNSFRIYFSLVGQVRLISLTGGEPLLYPHLAELIEYLLGYEQSFQKLEVFTNGATVITEMVLSSMSKSEKVSLFIDNYGPEISTKVDEIEQKCKKFNVKYNIRNYSGEDVYLGGWVDRSILSKKLDDETAKAHFSKCVVAKPGGRLFTIFGRYLAFCATPYCGYRVGKIPEKDVLYIDLCDDKVTLEKMQNKLFEMDKVEFNPGCAWCNGLGIYKDVERFTPGEQVEVDE